MKLLVVTAVLNPGERLIKTRLSILHQEIAQNDEIIHVIWDCLSVDGTEEKLKSNIFRDAIVIRAKDKGLYDALTRVFNQYDAEIYCYLNAGDIWFRNTAQAVFETFKRNPQNLWISGRQTILNSDWSFRSSRLPPRYRTEFIRRGLYDGNRISMIQQESTFWRRELNNKGDWNRFRSLKLAGDAYLWFCFASYSEPLVLDHPLGGFLKHENHLSSNLNDYRREMKSFSEPRRYFDLITKYLEWILWKLPDKAKLNIFPRIRRFERVNDEVKKE